MPKQSEVKTPSPQSAHAKLMRTLAALPPPRIVGVADADAVRERVEHMRAVQQAFGIYFDAVAADTTNHLGGHVDWAKANNILFDAANEDPDYDFVAALVRAGCRFDVARLAA